MPPKYVDLTGKRFGYLVVLELSHRDKFKSIWWKCLCDCGNEKLGRGDSLRQGKLISCGCYNKDKSKKEIGYSAKYRKYDHYRRNSKRREINFDLSFDEFINITSQNCFYCGSEPKQICKTTSKNGDYIYNGIDRQDNNKGYIIENCVPCCKVCNRAKNVLDVNEFQKWIDRVVKHRVYNI